MKKKKKLLACMMLYIVAVMRLILAHSTLLNVSYLLLSGSYISQKMLAYHWLSAAKPQSCHEN